MGRFIAPYAQLCCALILVFVLPAHSSTSEQTLARARQQLDSGQIAVAIHTLAEYRRLHPNNPDTYNLLGIAFSRQGNISKAVEMFREFARLSPDQPQAYNNLGAAYVRIGNTKAAVQAFRHSLALVPEDVNALYNLGALLNALHRYSTAQPLLEHALKIQESAPIVYELALATAGIGESHEALRLLEATPPPSGLQSVPWFRLMGTLYLREQNLSEAKRYLERALKVSPDDEQSLYALAVLRVKSGQAAQAVQALEQTMRQLPASDRCIRIGSILERLGASDAAIQQFVHATELDPQSSGAFYDLAVARLKKNDVQGAREAVARSLKIRPTGEAHDLLGEICEDEGEFKKALQHYQEAARLDPANDRFIFDLGVELILHNNYSAAEMVFQIARKRFPRSARIALGLGAADYMKGERREAVAQFLDAANLDPSYESAYMFLGEATEFAGSRLPSVIAKLSYIARQEPDSSRIQYYYGAALVREMEHTGNVAEAGEALGALRRAAALKPGDPRVYYELGEIARLENQQDQAARMYQKAISLDPKFADALYKLAQIYVRQGRRKDAERLFLRQRDAVIAAKRELYRRQSEIKSFILQVRSTD